MMESSPLDLLPLFRALARRIAGGSPPQWPIPTFEAESYLFRFFLRRMLTLFDILTYQSTSPRELGELLGTPTRVAELGYLLLGVRYSDLDLTERRRLADYFVRILRAFRPDEPFCQGGKNFLASGMPTAKTLDRLREINAAGRQQLLRLTASLFSLVEFIHIGVHQYGREIRGPYAKGPDKFILIRAHTDLRPVEMWPFTRDFHYDGIEIVEVYRGSAQGIQFDLTNHMNSPFLLPPRLCAATVTGFRDHLIEPIEGWTDLLDLVLRIVDHGIKSTASFTRLDWLRKHLEARYLVLRPLAKQAGCSSDPAPEEVEHLADQPQIYTDLSGTLTGSYDDVMRRFCTDFEISIPPAK